MNKTARFFLRFALCAACLLAIHAGALAGDPVPAPEFLPPGAHTEATPPASPAPAIEPAHPLQISSSAQIPQPAPPQIPFNAQNKASAKQIYALIRQIQESEFDPEKSLAAITKLQDEMAQTDFAPVHSLDDYIKDSLTLNTLRSKDIKTQRTNTGKGDKENGNKTGGKAGIGFFNLSAGGDYEKSNSQKHEEQNTADVSISSTNDPAILDKARQQQATSYGLLLNDLKRLGFSRPVDAERIYGKWRWRCTGDAATYEFDFKPDGTVYVRLKADNASGWTDHLFPNKGRGQWKLDYRCISLEMNDANLAGFWKQHPLIFFSNKEIISIDDEKILLACDEDNELKKIVEAKK